MGILPQALIQTEADRRPPVFERPSGRIGFWGRMIILLPPAA